MRPRHLTRWPYLTEVLNGIYGRPCYQRSYCPFMVVKILPRAGSNSVREISRPALKSTELPGLLYIYILMKDHIFKSTLSYM